MMFLSRLREKDSYYKLCYSTALAFFLIFAESLIPHPIPFLRYGFANIALLMTMRILAIKEFIMLVMLKVLLSSFFAGNIFTPFFLISLFCSLSVYSIVFLLRKINTISFVGLSAISSFTYNILHSIFLYYFILGKASLRILSFHILLGNISGLACGLIANEIYSVYEENVLKTVEFKKRENSNNSIRFSYRVFLRIFFVVIFVFIFNLLTPRGSIICRLFTFPVTSEALNISIRRSALIVFSYILSMIFSFFYKPRGNFIRITLQIYSSFVVNFYNTNDNKNFKNIVFSLKNTLNIQKQKIAQN